MEIGLVYEDAQMMHSSCEAYSMDEAGASPVLKKSALDGSIVLDGVEGTRASVFFSKCKNMF